MSSWSAVAGSGGTDTFSGVERLVWGVVLLGIALARQAGILDGDIGVEFAGYATCLFAFRVFWGHGKHTITAAGLYSLGVGVFVGVSAIAWAGLPGQLRDSFFTITMMAVLSTWVMWVVFWTSDAENESNAIVTCDRNLAGRLILVAVAWVVLGYAMLRISAGSPGVQTSVAVPIQLTLGGLSTLLAGIFLRSLPARSRMFPVVATGVILLFFTAQVFSGYGRLNMVSLGLVAALMLAVASRSRLLKMLVILGIPVALFVFSVMRTKFLMSEYGGDGSHEFGGAMSVFSPLRDAARVYEIVSSGAVAPGSGESFFAFFTFWVPRSIWPGKPQAFGEVLNQLLVPTAVRNEDQSYAALALGEFIYNWGAWGLVPFVLVMGFLIRWLDRRLKIALSRPNPTFNQMVTAVIMLMIVADVPNLAWGGFYGFMSRLGIRCFPLFVLMLTVWLVRGGVSTHSSKPAVSVARCWRG